MPQAQTKTNAKKAPPKSKRPNQKKLRKAQEIGILSDVAVSHTSKAKIMRAVKKIKQ